MDTGGNLFHTLSKSLSLASSSPSVESESGGGKMAPLDANLWFTPTSSSSMGLEGLISPLPSHSNLSSPPVHDNTFSPVPISEFGPLAESLGFSTSPSSAVPSSSTSPLMGSGSASHKGLPFEHRLSCSGPGGASAPVGEDAGVPRPLEFLHSVPVPPFLTKTFELVDEKALDDVICWGARGESFVVWDPVELSRSVLPRHFKHNNFSTFVRQLNTYGFRKIDTDRWEFANEDFQQGKKHLLKNIHRRRSSQAPQISCSIGSSVETGKSRFDGEIEKLRRDNDLLMHEVVKLKKEHLTTIHHMDSVKLKMQSAEQKQKQMISFSAKLLQNPLFLDHIKKKKELREVGSTRNTRKFLKHQQSNRYDSETSSAKATASYMHSKLESRVGEQLPGHISQGKEEKEEKDNADDGRKELLLTSDEVGVQMPFPMHVESNDVAFQGKNVMTSQENVSSGGSGYFISFPEDVLEERIFSNLVTPVADSITIPDDTWNIEFDSGQTFIGSGHDDWINFTNYNTQDPDIAAGPSTLLDLGLQQDLDCLALENLGSEDLPLKEFENQAGMLKENPVKRIDP